MTAEMSDDPRSIMLIPELMMTWEGLIGQRVSTGSIS
jgi:hypothetical protein